MKFILGSKMNMTQIWVNDKVVATTPVQAGPCVVTQVKTKQKDGYEALQLAFGNRKSKNINKPQREKFAKLNLSPAHVREFATDKAGDVKVGDTISVATFAEGDGISVTGVSKGKGFQGVVKRHHFAGGRKSHGNKDQLRMPGSVGPKGPAHIFKGTRMAGHMGDERVTVRGLEVVKIDADNNILYIKGAIPGGVNGLVMIKGEGELVVSAPEEAKKAEEVKEEAVAENKEEAVANEAKEEEKPEPAKEEAAPADVK